MTSQRRPFPALYLGIVMFALGLLVATLLHKGPGLSGPSPDADRGDGRDTPLFRLGEKVYTRADLSYGQAAQWHELDSQMRDRQVDILRQAALDAHIRHLAAERGEDPTRLRETLLRAPEPTAEAIERFYSEHRERIGRPLHEVRELIGNALRQDAENRIAQDLINGLVQQGQLALLLPTSTAPEARFELAGAPAVGPENAPVQIVEFADYRCSHCKVASQTLKRLLEANPEGIRWVLLDFPILGKASRELAQAAWCAGQQGRYWEFHHALFERQGQIKPENLGELATELGLDGEALAACQQGEDSLAAIRRTERQGIEAGLRGTPAIFINGRAHDGNLEDELIQAVEQALQQTSPAGDRS